MRAARMEGVEYILKKLDVFEFVSEEAAMRRGAKGPV